MKPVFLITAAIFLAVAAVSATHAATQHNWPAAISCAISALAVTVSLAAVSRLRP